MTKGLMTEVADNPYKWYESQDAAYPPGYMIEN